MKRIAILTSGGDAPGMNAAIRAAVRYCIYNGIEIYGVYRGYKGLIEGEVKEMDISSVGDIIHRGGTILRSARSEEFMTKEGLEKAMNVLNVFKIGGLIVVGGDGSLTGSLKIAENGIPVAGVPATIDNDLSYTDYTIGFDTAVNTVLDAVSKLRDTTSSHERVSIIQVMGRNCGDIALYSGLGGGAEEILVPEFPYDIDNICQRMITSMSRGKIQSIIMMAEGAGDPKVVCEQIKENTGMEVRITTLGHIQRGGSPSSQDRILASRFAATAVRSLLDGKFNKAIGIKNNEIITMDIKEALKVKKDFNDELYNLTKILSI